MNTQIFFADLTYTNQGVSSNSFPFGAALVAAYAKKKLGNSIKTDLFKYPNDFKNHLETKTPQIVCFTNYSWTFDISNEFAKRIKKKFPATIIIFGGPNYPNEVYTQKNFLSSYRAVDFYIKGEGELAFVELFRSLEKYNFNLENFKKNREKPGNCHYLIEDEFISGATLPRIENLDDIPSPYLSGDLDKFFDKSLTPTVQTIRGCPFKCTFCQEGKDYFTKIYKFSRERIKKELEYIAKRVKVPNLMLVDSNFGMYKQDIEISKDISEIRKRDNWPKYIEVSLGKSKKILESISILEGSLPVHVAVQSTDADVLDNINRKNIPAATQIEVIKEGDSFGGSSFSEVILGLPEDTKEKHFKSMFDMIDAGANVVRSHQLLMLPDSDMDTKEYREKYKMDTRYRVQPKCFGYYELYGEVFPCAEIDELCVTNKTFSYEDYLQSRHLDLTVELFYNNGIFKEYINILKQNDISASTLVKKINQEIPKSELKNFYDGYMKETKESLWKEKSTLDQHMKSTNVVDNYLKKDLRANEQLKYRATAFFEKMNEMHDLVLKSTKDLLREKDSLEDKEENYLNELTRFNLLRKDKLLSLDIKRTEKFHYNFIKISKRDFDDTPFVHFNSKKMDINFSHSKNQKELILRYLDQFGSSKNNLGTILSKSPVHEFYRQTTSTD